MASSGPTRRDELLQRQPSEKDSTLAKALAPEEIRRGDYVTPLEEIAEWPSFFWCVDSTLLPCDKPVRIRFKPSCGGVPLRVMDVCLPFVLVKLPRGDRRTLDVRKCQVARLGESYARAAWKAFKNAKPVGALLSRL
jgi:hypothetical protein